MKHKIKIVLDFEPWHEEVEVIELFTHLEQEFACVMKPRMDRNSMRHYRRAIVEVTTGMSVNDLVDSYSKTMEKYIEDFKKWIDTEVKTPNRLEQDLEPYPKINSNIKL